jgi:hypothetical protein
MQRRHGEERDGTYRIDESSFAPITCEFWQENRIPPSGYPRAQFVRWLPSDSEKNYYRRGNKEFAVDSVGYEFNSLGYRGLEFDRAPGEAAVMFVGDSNTLGVGIPWDGLWTSLVTNRIEHHWGVPVRQFNLGRGATGSDYVAMMIHQSIGVLKPDAVFVLWSFFTRIMWFADTRRTINFYPKSAPPGADRRDYHAYLRLATDSHGFFNYVRNFHLVRERLLRLGIPYYWGNLEQVSPELLGHYMPLDGYVGSWNRLDSARDGIHAGLKSHSDFAVRVISAVERDAVGWSAKDIPALTTLTAPDISLRVPSKHEVHNTIETSSIHALIAKLWHGRRGRAMKRKDPHIY